MAMSKKDYEKAAAIVREHYMAVGELSNEKGQRYQAHAIATAVQNSFVMLFKNDNPRFDAGRFLDACGDSGSGRMLVKYVKSH